MSLVKFFDAGHRVGARRVRVAALAGLLAAVAASAVRAHDVVYISLIGGVLRSADDGATWTLLKTTTSFIPAGFTTTLIRSPRYEPVTGTLFLGNNAAKTLAADSRGFLFSSPDLGATWSQAAGPSDVPDAPAYQMSPLGFDAKGRLYVSVNSSAAAIGLSYAVLARSEDGGKTWKKMGDAVANWGGACELNSFVATRKGTLLVASSNAGPSGSIAAPVAGIYRSADDGASWTLAISSVALSPAGSSSKSDFGRRLLQDFSDVVYALTLSGHLYRSEDEGATWTLAASSMTIGSAGWDVVLGPGNSLLLLPAFLGKEAILKSTSRGSTWTTLLTTTTMGGGLSLSEGGFIHTRQDGVMFAAGSRASPAGEVIWTSKDGGTTWTVAATTVTLGFGGLNHGAFISARSALAAEIAKNPGDVVAVNNVFDPTKGEKTTAVINLKASATLTVKLFTLDGHLVATLLDAARDAGFVYVDWFGKNADGDVVSAGTYLLSVQTSDGMKEVRKIVVIK